MCDSCEKRFCVFKYKFDLQFILRRYPPMQMFRRKEHAVVDVCLSAHAGVPPKEARRGRCLFSTDHSNYKQLNLTGLIESPMAGVASLALAMTNTRHGVT